MSWFKLNDSMYINMQEDMVVLMDVSGIPEAEYSMVVVGTSS